MGHPSPFEAAAVHARGQRRRTVRDGGLCG